MDTAAARYYASLDVFALENRIRDAAADALLYPLGQHTQRRIGNLAAEVRRRCGEPGSDNDSERYTRRHLLPLVERLTAYVDTMPADPE